MKYKGLIITSIAAAIGSATILGGCEWRPFGRDYFVTAGDGKAGSSYGEPWLNSVTYGTVKEDTAHDGANGDVYLAANYDKIISSTIEEGQDSVGVQEDAVNKVSSVLLDIMKNPGGTDAGKQVHNLYELYTDVEGRADSWKRDILPLIKPLQDAGNLAELSDYLSSDAYFNNGENIVSFDYDLDYNDPEHYSFVIIPTALSLGDAAEYKSKSEYGEKTEDIFRKQAALLLEKAGYSDDGAGSIINRALEFEEKIAGVMKTQEFKYSSEYISSVNNQVNLSDIKSEEKAFPLSRMLEAYGIADCEHLYMIEPEWFTGMAEMYTEENFDSVKSYVLVKTLQGFADSSDEETYTGIRDIYNEANGIKKQETIAEHAVSYIKGNMPELTGRLFAEGQVSASDKEAVSKLAEMIRDEAKSIIEDFSFLSDNTKKMEIQKLDSMKINVAYSESSPAVPEIKIKSKSEGGSLPEALVAIREADRKEKLKRLNKEVLPDEFDGDVTDVSVKYFGQGNSLNINAGAVTGYYKSDMSREDLLGGLGTLIAREMFNAVFGTGADYDADGKYAPYRTDADNKGYNEEYKALREELDSIKPFKNDTALNSLRVSDSVIRELNSFKAVKAIADKEGIGKDSLIKAMARSRFTVMREDVMENTGLNSSDALPYIVVNIVNKY